MKVYLIVLRGQGDTDVRVVDEETFKWVTSEEPGAPHGAASGWIDPLVPEYQKQRLQSEEPSRWPLQITRGSWWNDRMLAAYAMPEYDAAYDRLADALKAVKNRGDEVEDTVEGEIY